MIKIFCFGNELIKEDSLAKEIAREIDIEGIEFIFCDSPENLLENNIEKLYIMDVVKDLNEVRIIKDIDKIRLNSIVSLHDFDLGYFLKMMKGLGRINDIVIIGLPMKGNKEKIKNNIIKIMNEIKK